MDSQAYDYILKLLTEKGWTKERQTNITNILEYFQNRYTINSLQKEFLQNFSDIEILVRNVTGRQTYIVQFFPTEYTVSEYFLNLYEKYTETSLVPIGGLECYNTFLMLSSELKIYGVFEKEIALLGNDVFEFLINLYEDRKIKWNIAK